MMACTTLDRAGRDQHGDRGGAWPTSNRLPVLLLPGDVFASRRPDPVLQQVEDFADATVSANDCFRPVSRYFDRITRPEQLIDRLPRAMRDAARSGRRAARSRWPCARTCRPRRSTFRDSFFERHVWRIRRPPPDAAEIDDASRALARRQGAADRRRRRRDLCRRGGGAGRVSPTTHGIPVAETQAGKGACPDQPMR